MAVPLRILHLEDDPADVELMSSVLSSHGLVYEPVRVDDQAGFVAALRAGGLDLILADYTLPGFDGLAALDLARSLAPEVPFIIVTGTLSETRALEAVRAGVTDYVLKTQLNRLAPAVQRALREANERAQLRQAQAAARGTRLLLEKTFASLSEAVLLVEPDTRLVVAVNPALERMFGYSAQELVGQTTLHLHVDQAHFESYGQQLVAALEGGGLFQIEYPMRRRDGTVFLAEIVINEIRDEDGQATVVAGILRDITERRQAQAALERRVRQQAAVAELGQRALSGVTLAELMDSAVRRVAETLEVEFASLFELLPLDELVLRAGVGWKADAVGQAVAGPGTESQAGYTLLENGPVIVEDWQAETRFAARPLLADHGVASGVTVPVPGHPRPFGVLAAHTTRPRAFTRDDVHFIQAVANVLAVAHERKHTEEALRRSEEQFAKGFRAGPDALVISRMGDGRVVEVNDSWEALFGYSRAEVIGRTPLELGVYASPADRERIESQLQAQGFVREAAATVVRRSGELRLASVSAEPILVRGEPCLYTVIRDVTEHRRLEQQIRTQAERATFLAELSRVVSASLDVRATLQTVTQRLLPALADFCFVYRLDSAGAVHVLAGTHRDPARAQLLETFTAWYAPTPDQPNSLVARAMRTGQPVVMPELPPRVWEYAGADAAILRVRTELAPRSALAAPLVARGRVLGVLVLVYAESGRRYSEADLPLVEEITQRTALAMDNALLYGEAQALNADLEQRVGARTAELEQSRQELRRLSARLEATREEERTRLSREVHDELGGALTGIKMDIVRLRRLLGERPPEVEAQLAELIGLIDGTVKTVRRIATDLRPAVLDDFGLEAAIEWQAQDFERRTGIRCHLDASLSPGDWAPEGATAVFRVFQETLTNVARHAQATQVDVRLDEQAGCLVLRVHDNGRGIDGAALANTRSLGVVGMRERIHLLSGELDIRRADPGGTLVSIRVPLEHLRRNGATAV